MKTMNSQSEVISLRRNLIKYQINQQKNKNIFDHQDNSNTPDHTHSDCNSISLLTVKQTQKTKQNNPHKQSCANKLCKLFIIECKQKQKHIEIKLQTLCGKCRQQFKIQMYCVYCKQVYFDNTDDGKQWIMCQLCEKWVHSQCADFNTKNNPNALFKCIRCKVLPTTINSTGRRGNVRNVINKYERKKNNEFLNTIGFEWQLKVDEINQDMENIRQYLNIK